MHRGGRSCSTPTTLTGSRELCWVVMIGSLSSTSSDETRRADAGDDDFFCDLGIDSSPITSSDEARRADAGDNDFFCVLGIGSSPITSAPTRRRQQRERARSLCRRTQRAVGRRNLARLPRRTWAEPTRSTPPRRAGRPASRASSPTMPQRAIARVSWDPTFSGDAALAARHCIPERAFTSFVGYGSCEAAPRLMKSGRRRLRTPARWSRHRRGTTGT